LNKPAKQEETNMGTTDQGPGTPPQDQMQTPPQPGAQSSGLQDNMASALAYIPIVAIVFLIIEPFNRNRTVRFHSFQSIFYALSVFVVSFALSLFFVALNAIPVIGTIIGLIGGLLSGLLLPLLFFGVWLFLMYKAYKEEKFLLPVIGAFAEKQA
jgi:uncharacterized membrane protein